jgi:hypothetical protein
MHPFMYLHLINDRTRELQRAGVATQRFERPSTEPAQQDVVIRRATASDGPALAALSALDAAPLPLGPALIAEVAGSPRAVLPLDGGHSFGDPFRRTDELVALLELRAAQIAREEGGANRERGRLAWMAPAALRRLV